jgi:predicted Zn-dependent protease with MMP-like domain
MDISVDEFEELVERAMEGLPEAFRERLDNVELVIEDFASPRQLALVHQSYPWALLGLYEGIPLTRRNTYYNLVLPDKITLFRMPILAQCSTPDAVQREVQRVVMHEIAHHFGLSDEDLKKTRV